MFRTHPTTTPTTQMPGSTRRAIFAGTLLKILKQTLFVALLFLAASRVSLMSQTPTPTPDSDEVKRLKEEKAQSDLRKGIAEDRKAVRSSNLRIADAVDTIAYDSPCESFRA